MQKQSGNQAKSRYLASSVRRGLEDLGLHVTGQVGVDGNHEELLDLGAELPGSLHQQLLTRLDLLLACHREG